MKKGMVIGNRNDGNSYNRNEEWEQGIGMGNGEKGMGNGERGTGKLIFNLKNIANRNWEWKREW